MAGPYDFHVMMRVEIEAALLNGSLAARDLPEVWREHMGGTNLDSRCQATRAARPALILVAGGRVAT
jgi:Zn-dependent M32 family carboxypeptidase